MLSRVASKLYWMARYLERAENHARFLTVTHGYAQELRGVFHGGAEPCWDVAHQLFTGKPSEARRPLEVLWRLSLDPDLPSSLFASVSRARENARTIRDTIASEMWEQINIMFLDLRRESNASVSEQNILAALERLRNGAHLYQGLRDHTMMRGDEWHFLRIGQFLERADCTTRMLIAMTHHPVLAIAAEAGHSIDTLHLSTLLRGCTAFEACTRASTGLLTPERVTEFLLLEPRFPRSVSLCVQVSSHSLHALSGTPESHYGNAAEQQFGRLLAELRFIGVEEIMAQGLNNYLSRVLQQLVQLSEGVSAEYLR